MFMYLERMTADGWLTYRGKLFPPLIKFKASTLTITIIVRVQAKFLLKATAITAVTAYFCR
jgi:hypothetical protein